MATQGEYTTRLTEITRSLSPASINRFRATLPTVNTTESQSSLLRRMATSFPNIFESETTNDISSGVQRVSYPLYYLTKIIKGEQHVNFSADKVAKAAQAMAATDAYENSTQGWMLGGAQDAMSALYMCFTTGNWDFSKHMQTARQMRVTEANFKALKAAGLNDAETILLTGVRYQGSRPQFLYAPLYMPAEERRTHEANMKAAQYLHDPTKEPGWMDSLTLTSAAVSLITFNLTVAGTIKAVETAATITGANRLPGLFRTAGTIIPRVSSTAAMIEGTAATGYEVMQLAQTQPAARAATGTWGRIQTALESRPARIAAKASGVLMVGVDGYHALQLFSRERAAGVNCTTWSDALATGVVAGDAVGTTLLFIPKLGTAPGLVTLGVTQGTKLIVNDLFGLTDIDGGNVAAGVQAVMNENYVNPQRHYQMSFHDVYKALKDPSSPAYQYLQTRFGAHLPEIEKDVNARMSRMPYNRRSRSYVNPSDVYELPESVIKKLKQEVASTGIPDEFLDSQFRTITMPAELGRTTYRVQDVIADLGGTRTSGRVSNRGVLYHYLKDDLGLSEADIDKVLQSAISQREQAEQYTRYLEDAIRLNRRDPEGRLLIRDGRPVDWSMADYTFKIDEVVAGIVSTKTNGRPFTSGGFFALPDSDMVRAYEARIEALMTKKRDELTEYYHRCIMEQRPRDGATLIPPALGQGERVNTVALASSNPLLDGLSVAAGGVVPVEAGTIARVQVVGAGFVELPKLAFRSGVVTGGEDVLSGSSVVARTQPVLRVDEQAEARNLGYSSLFS